MATVESATLPNSRGDLDPQSPTALIHSYLAGKGLQPTSANVRGLLEQNNRMPGASDAGKPIPQLTNMLPSTEAEDRAAIAAVRGVSGGANSGLPTPPIPPADSPPPRVAGADTGADTGASGGMSAGDIAALITSALFGGAGAYQYANRARGDRTVGGEPNTSAQPSSEVARRPIIEPDPVDIRLKPTLPQTDARPALPAPAPVIDADPMQRAITRAVQPADVMPTGLPGPLSPVDIFNLQSRGQTIGGPRLTINPNVDTSRDIVPPEPDPRLTRGARGEPNIKLRPRVRVGG